MSFLAHFLSVVHHAPVVHVTSRLTVTFIHSLDPTNCFFISILDLANIISTTFNLLVLAHKHLADKNVCVAVWWLFIAGCVFVRFKSLTKLFTPFFFNNAPAWRH